MQSPSARAPESASIFFSSVSLDGPGPAGKEADLWHANRYLPALRGTFPGAAISRFASPARGTFTSIVELPVGKAARAAAIQAAGSHQETAAGVKAVERFVAAPLSARKRHDAGPWESLILHAPFVFAIFFTVPPEREVEFNRWYEEEHIDLLLACTAWVACRRFRLVTPHPAGRTHLALHSITDLRALESPERDAAVATPWRARLAAQGWFVGEYRICYRLA